jgi:tetratricopeptide (TPR) repeat protein
LNKQNFLNIVRTPTAIGAQDIAGLEEVAASFPFCQIAHLLIAKGLKDYGSMHAEQKLKKAAAYSLNRKKLKEIVQSVGAGFTPAPTLTPVPIPEEKIKYDEIEENLKLIERFRLDTVGAGTGVNPAPTPHYIYSSRLEDVFLQELEIDSAHHQSDAGLLLDYLDYIHENKLGKMRDKKKQKEIIEKFINADPVIPTLKPHTLPENQEDLASGSSRINKNPVSETFAKILLLQGKKDKAIEIYEQLILKFPEKKAYFAAEIDKLKK